MESKAIASFRIAKFDCQTWLSFFRRTASTLLAIWLITAAPLSLADELWTLVGQAPAVKSPDESTRAVLKINPEKKTFTWSSHDSVLGEIPATEGVTQGTRLFWTNSPVTNPTLVVFSGSDSSGNIKFYANVTLKPPAHAVVDVMKIDPNGKLPPKRVRYLLTLPKPLIFVPGVAGSELDLVTGDNIWLGVGENHMQMGMKPDGSSENEIVAPDILRTGRVSGDVYKPLIDALTIKKGNYLEYKIDRDVQRLTKGGCDTTQAGNAPTLFVFPYDWRLGLAESATRLKDYIGCIQSLYQTMNPKVSVAKINILTHSMGSLIARRYILDNLHTTGGHQVDKLITMAVP